MNAATLPGLLALSLVALAACDARSPPGATAAAPVAATPTTSTSASTTAATQARVATPVDRFAARSREAVNPDNSTMVMLYFDLAGLTPPFEEWVESDSRVKSAASIDKAARRDAVRAELAAAFAAVRDVGRIRLSVANAGLSDYDPTYGEFTVRALSPASELSFQALGQKVVTRFENGQTAQLWRVPAAQAQAVRDRVAGRNVSLDVLLRLAGVQPGTGGGAIVTHIEEYALRASDGSTLARLP